MAAFDPKIMAQVHLMAAKDLSNKARKASLRANKYGGKYTVEGRIALRDAAEYRADAKHRRDAAKRCLGALVK